MSVTIRRYRADDRAALCAFWKEHWGDGFIVAHGETFRPEDVEGFIAEEAGEWVGVVTYWARGQGCEIVSIDSLRPGRGVGSRLIEEVADQARGLGCKRVHLATTNDNLEALGFYQKRGFCLVMVRPGAVNESRKVKPSISLIGMHGIPLRDEIELELPL